MNINAKRGFLRVCAVVLALALFGPADAWARGGFRGGGFKSSSGVRSLGTTRSLGSSSSSKSPFSGWGSSTKPAASSASGSAASSSRLGDGIGSSSARAGTGVYDSARRSGTLFSTKAEAQSAFKSRYQSQYGSRFSSEPSSRPGWIPQSTQINGQNVNVVYNQGLGGYGYMDMMGRWMLYDALSDAAMMGVLMSHHNYAYGAPVYQSHDSGFLGFALFLLVLVLLIVVAVNIMKSARRKDDEEERRSTRYW